MSFVGFSDDSEAGDNEKEEEDDDDESFIGFSDDFEAEDVDDHDRYSVMKEFASIPSYELHQPPLTNKTSQLTTIKEEYQFSPNKEVPEKIDSGANGYP
ncbi:hypothetical protein DID88_005486 [Monilinia fructigena]|uniref:Uncharacterized protein n=1 Tax=Monilinia fructigena TaxID=38457 RepID=A0A395J2A7_9HELO|nr:hypothetical protein DID88_005486 [Monilinia fructigena]